ncbi:hypothetical protein NPIL_633861 [Nephila pilipes]|uniref:Uncharacterized protein n=1 Tax=Nephila pilipes TaxID=299642 RepID=A0A8X6R1M1_NEPPI|nr:hypothetical protein NPIL_633861 [Nephila pilipes]
MLSTGGINSATQRNGVIVPAAHTETFPPKMYEIYNHSATSCINGLLDYFCRSLVTISIVPLGHGENEDKHSDSEACLNLSTCRN